MVTGMKAIFFDSPKLGVGKLDNFERISPRFSLVLSENLIYFFFSQYFKKIFLIVIPCRTGIGGDIGFFPITIGADFALLDFCEQFKSLRERFRKRINHRERVDTEIH